MMHPHITKIGGESFLTKLKLSCLKEPLVIFTDIVDFSYSALMPDSKDYKNTLHFGYPPCLGMLHPENRKVFSKIIEFGIRKRGTTWVPMYFPLILVTQKLTKVCL